ncbi:MAG: hypothetical protein ACRD96_27815, partial [Bryobacteraceae bacterium]
ALGRYGEAKELYEIERTKTGLAYTLAEMARVSHLLGDFSSSIEAMTAALAVAGEANVPSVVAYVVGVQREILGARV